MTPSANPRTPRPPALRTLRSVGAWLAAGVAAAAAVSASYQRHGERADRARFPAPGQLVDIGGRRLHLWHTGTHHHGPTVIGFPALGGTAIEWTALQRALSTDTPVCLYDRAGLGWSDPAPWPRTAAAMVDELHQALHVAGIEPPFVLAGNSIGGLVARLYAARHPDQVAGLVLLDSSHPDQLQRLSSPGQRSRTTTHRLRALRYLLRWRGVRRARVALGLDTALRRDTALDVPPEFLDAAVAEVLSSNHRRAAAQEMLGLAATMGQVCAEARHLGDLPLTVLSANDSRREPEWEPVWQQMQTELATLSRDSVHLTADRAGHFIQRDDPELVAHVIRETSARAARWWHNRRAHTSDR